MAGIYETYDGTVVTLLDEPDESCSNPDHTAGNKIPDLGGAPESSKVPLHTDRQRQS